MSVSIIIPAHNAGRFLRGTLNSVRLQAHRDFEAVVVDDGSVDDTFDISQEFAHMDGRFHVISQPNAGPAVAVPSSQIRSTAHIVTPASGCLFNSSTRELTKSGSQ